jgi:radical SAM protein with 4Fe4S-binding SPASM domain
MPNTRKVLSAPINVDFLITSRCNLRCLHCSASSGPTPADALTTVEQRAVIKELAKCQVLEIALTGGEPLLHEDFFTLAHDVVEHPIKLQINTNAILVTDDIVRRLRRLGRPPFINVSLDGATAETHDCIRGPGSFEGIMRGIRRLVDGGLSVRPFMVVTALNYHEIGAAVGLARGLDCGRMFLSFPCHTGRAICYAEQMEMAPEQWRKALEAAAAADRQNPGALSGPCIELARFYSALCDGKLNACGAGDGTFGNCGGGLSVMAIGVNGDVVPCQMVLGYVAGNLRKEPIIDIWRNSPVFHHVRSVRGKALREVQGCQECPLHMQCKGPCPASGYGRYGVWPARAMPCYMTALEALGPSHRQVIEHIVQEKSLCQS